MCKFSIAILATLSCLFIIGCNHDKHNGSEFPGKSFTIEVPELKLDPDPVVKISEIFDQITSVKLETNSDGLISGEVIYKIVEYDNRIYLLDINLRPGLNSSYGDIYSFDKKTGKFLVKVGHKGKGPGEYLMGNDFNIWQDELSIVDGSSGKIVFYSLSGNFIKELKPDFRFNKFALLDTSSCFFWLNNYNKKVTSKDNEIIMCDSKLNHIVGILNERHNTKTVSPTSFIVFDSLLYFNRSYSDTIYSINKKGNVNLAYILKLNPANEIPEELLKDEVLTIEKQRKEKNFAKIFRYYILKDYLYFELMAKDHYMMLISKKSGKIKLIPTKKIENDLSETGTNLNICGVLTEGNTLIGYVSAHDIVENGRNPDTKITSLSEHIKEEDNPVIVYYKIIDF